MFTEETRLKYAGRGFHDLSIEEISGILNTALNDDEWHTPSVSDISIKQQTQFCVYGWCNISKHNTYHDKEVWFNINGDCVHIWVEEYVKGRANRNLQLQIHNFYTLGNILEILKPVKQPNQ